MDAVEFFKAKSRMCLKNECRDCVLTDNCTNEIECDHDYKTEVELVEKWAKENPIPKYTYLDDLLLKFPKTRMTDVGNPEVCINVLYDAKIKCAHSICKECWNREYKK